MIAQIAVTVYYLVKFLCHVLLRFRTQLDIVLAAAVAGSVITSEQKTTVDNFFNGAQAACDILLQVVG